MEKERKIKVLSLVALIVAVLGLTVAFAALSQTLTITGFSGMAQEDWDIRIQGDDKFHEKYAASNQTFECTFCKDAMTTGKLNLNVGENFDTLSGFEFLLEKPGDFGVISFYVANYGDIDAKLEQIISNKPVCTSETGNEEDAKLVCDNLVINYGYPKENIPADQFGEWSEIIETFKEGEVLPGNHTTNSSYFEKRHVIMVVELNKNLEVLPTSKVTVSNLGFTLKYVQK